MPCCVPKCFAMIKAASLSNCVQNFLCTPLLAVFICKSSRRITGAKVVDIVKMFSAHGQILSGCYFGTQFPGLLPRLNVTFAF